MARVDHRDWTHRTDQRQANAHISNQAFLAAFASVIPNHPRYTAMQSKMRQVNQRMTMVRPMFAVVTARRPIPSSLKRRHVSSTRAFHRLH